MGSLITVNDSMQTNYTYQLSENAGQGFDARFTPSFSPSDMLKMGIFEGKYCNDCQNELPTSWFLEARVGDYPKPELNYFRVKSRQSLKVWKEKGWIHGPDPRGWFQWYCRYYMGRRLNEIDNLQIKRWRQFSRHAGQIRANCEPGDIFCRRKQRQALLQWAHDPFI